MQFKSLVNFTVDSPLADGRLTTWGIARDRPADEPKEGHPDFTPDLGGSYGWDYKGHFEYINPLKAIAPTAGTPRTAMVIGGWTLVSGLWQETSAAGTLKVKFLSYYDGRPNRYLAGDYGVVRSNANYMPDLLFYMRRYPADAADTDPPVFAIFFLGDSVGPYYGIILPALGLGGDFWTGLTGDATAQLKHPFLVGRPQGLGAGQWTIIDEFKGGGAVQKTQNEAENYSTQVLKVEYTDGWMLVNFSDASETWAYTGNWVDALGREVEFALPTGPIEIDVCGHTASFLMAQLTYPTDANLDAHTWMFAADPPYEQAVNYNLIDTTPAGTAITASEHPDSGPGVSKPRLRFTGPGTARAVFYNCQEYRNATIAGVVSAPITSVGNDQVRVREASGTITDRWRGATADVVVEAKSPAPAIAACSAIYEACIVACAGDPVCEAACTDARTVCIAAAETAFALPTLPPNGKVTLEVGLKETAAAATFYRQHTGYILPPEFEKTAPQHVTATVHCADGIEARLQHKVVKNVCSFEGWAVDVAFKYLLNCAGVPDSMISIDAGITPAAMGDNYYFPVNDPKSERLLKFKFETSLISALDTMVETRDLEWGVDQNGSYFLRPRLVHTPGVFDWTLDDDTLVEDDIIYSFRSARSLDDYVNVIYVMAGSGWTASAHMLWDWLSITDPTAANFIGDDWWKVDMVPDGDNAVEVAERLWAQRSTLAHMVFWTSRAHPELMPDNYVRVQSTNMAIPVNTIFKITRKSWRCGGDGSDFSQEFEGVIVEEP